MNPQAQLQSFIAQYTGVANVGDTSENTGQCVGLVEKWLDVFQLPHIWGNAKDLLTNADTGVYTTIANTATNSPGVGDIFVFGTLYGGGMGHCGIVTQADVNTVTLFEQNDPTGSAPQIKQYPYLPGAVGWVHPNVFTATSSPTVTDQQVTDQLNAQIQATNACQSQLKEATAQSASLQTQLTAETEQVQSLQEQLKDEQAKNTTLQTQLDGEQKEIINLNTQIETQASSNKDYATEIYTLSNANTSLTNSFNSVVDGLSVTRTGKTLDQITKDALSKEDDIDLLLKAGGIASGIMHNVAKTLNLDDPTATDQQVANKIITYVKGLQGKLQNILPSKSEDGVITTGQSLGSRFIGWFWKPKGVKI